MPLVSDAPVLGVTRGRTRFDPIAWWAGHDGDRVALIDATRGEQCTYRALHALAEQWAGALQALGVRRGDRVGVLAGNRVHHVALFFGATRIGASLVPLNWRLAAVELARVLDDARPAVLLGEARFHATAAQALREAGIPEPIWCDLDTDASRWLARTDRPTSHDAAADDLALLLYSSGSTGAPKGIMMPHAQLHWNAVATTASWELSASDVGLVATPLFHTAGWGVFLLPLLQVGGRAVLLDGFDPDALLETLRSERITVAFGVPTQLDLLQARPAWGAPLPALRWMLAGGAPCPRRISAAVWDAGYAFREGYGLTECGPNCFATTEHLARTRPGTVGYPVQYLQMRLVPPSRGHTESEPFGELQLRGPQLFGGYYNAPTKTADVMTSDGWLRTGDLARRDADGVWSICGRQTDVFISGGENVYLGEVEAALLGCHGVAAASVVAVPDPRWGEVGVAVLVRAREREPVQGARVLAEVRTRLAGYKVPRHVVFVDALPQLGSGKIDRRAVAALVRSPDQSPSLEPV